MLNMNPSTGADASHIGARGLPGLFLLAIFLAGTVYAQAFPVKAVRIAVPYPAGGTADFFFRLILKLPEISAKLIAQGLYPAPSTPAQFDAHIRSETARYAKIVKEAGIRAD